MSSPDAITGSSFMPATKRSSSSFAMSIGFSIATTSALSASATGRVWKRCATAAGMRFSSSGGMRKFFRLMNGMPSLLRHHAVHHLGVDHAHVGEDLAERDRAVARLDGERLVELAPR